MLSLQKRFLFIHVPKTGGNSIQTVLKAYSEDKVTAKAGHQDGNERFEVRNDALALRKHASLGQYKAALDPDIYASLFKTAVMRNPWDMMISHYFSPHRGEREWNRDDFIKLVRHTPVLRHYIKENTLRDKISVKLQTLTGSPGRSLDADIDFLLKVESLDEDFKTLCGKLDIPYTPLPQRNASTRTHYTEYYDQETMRLVQRKFREEIDFGGYCFG